MAELTIKSRYSHADVLRVWASIDPTNERWQDMVNTAVENAALELHDTIGRLGIPRELVAYGWSGGKDSLALEVVMDRVGIPYGVLGTMSPLEFPEHLNWCERHIPGSVVWIDQRKYDIPWLADNLSKLFPRGGKDGYWWTLAGTRWSQDRYIERYRPKLMVYGRRLADNNVCGDPFGVAMGKGGVLTYTPIRHWSHELTLAVVKLAWLRPGRRMNPIYFKPEGFTNGTGTWPSHHYPDWDTGFATTHAIDPGILPQVRGILKPADDWLRRHAEELAAR